MLRMVVIHRFFVVESDLVVDKGDEATLQVNSPGEFARFDTLLGFACQISRKRAQFDTLLPFASQLPQTLNQFDLILGFARQLSRKRT